MNIKKTKQGTKSIDNEFIGYLLGQLEERFPNKLPTKDLSNYELAKLQGNQQVIAFIVEMQERLVNKKG